MRPLIDMSPVEFNTAILEVEKGNTWRDAQFPASPIGNA